jgi:hypothetical protein
VTLYRTDSIDLLEADDPRRVLEENSDDAVIELAVTTALSILAAAGHDVRKPPALLLGDTADRLEEHQAARVLYHARQMARAEEDGRVADVKKHAMRFATWLRDAQHTAAWGEAIVKHSNIRGSPIRYDADAICLIAKAHQLPDGKISATGRALLKRTGVSRRHLRRLLARN